MTRVIMLLLAVSAAGCRDHPRPGAKGSPLPRPPFTSAIAELQGTSPDGEKISGTATLVQERDAVKIVIRLTGLLPGRHGIHIHEHGVCEGPSFESAGEHFNPAGSKHGGPQQPVRHAGDLGNIVTRNDRTSEHELRSGAITLRKGKNSVMDRAIVVHARPDDYRTQPSGGAGPGIACGVIRRSR